MCRFVKLYVTMFVITYTLYAFIYVLCVSMYFTHPASL